MVIRMWMRRLPGLVLLLIVAAALRVTAETPAPTPPMGWNSWDAYGLSLTEDDLRANMIVLDAQLKDFGWHYIVVGPGWYITNPEDAATPENLQYFVNARGQYEPAPGRFPSSANGVGFRAIADDVHQHGLKFGITIMRGIPKQTFMTNKRIGTGLYTANRAADPADTCPVSQENFGVKPGPAGQAWYDALIKQYADWGVDLIKVDCIGTRAYKVAEIRMIRHAIQRSGRPIILALGPGPASVESTTEITHNAEMWDISRPVWDHWTRIDRGTDQSQSIYAQFPVLAKWASYAKPGNWPNAGTLPFGQLIPSPTHGKPRASRLTETEQRTALSLWAIARSPLFIGGNLTHMDDALKSLLTNPAILTMNQSGTNAILKTQDENGVVSWVSQSQDGKTQYLAIFNLGDTAIRIDNTLAAYGFIARAQYHLRDLWQRRELGIHNSITEELPAHGSIVYSLHE